MNQKYYPRETPRNGRAVLVDGVRTAFVKSFGVFQNCDTLELFSRTVSALLARLSFDPEELDEISCGVVIPQTKNANVARDTIINLKLGDHIHGYTLNRACTSSLHAIADATKSIRFGQSGLILAGGVECLSDVPITYSRDARDFLLQLSRAKSAHARLKAIKEFSLKDWIPKPPGLSEPLTGYTMGEHAELMAKIHCIPREAQDEFALRSHQKAALAAQQGYFDDEIIPVWPSPKYRDYVTADNIVRTDASLQALEKLKPAFDKKHGSITAGNASPLTDGASVSLIADQKQASELGLAAKAEIKDFVFVGVKPYPELLIGPAIAIPLLLRRNKLQVSDIDRYEIHEAFAAQVLCCLKMMNDSEFNEQHLGSAQAFGEIPMDRLNVNGGAIAIGHPFGATGSRLINTLANELIRADKSLGVVGICAAGGMAGAMLIERTN